MGGDNRKVVWWWFVSVAAGLLLVLASGAGGTVGAHPHAHMFRFALVWGGCLALVVLFPRKDFPRRLSPAAVILLLSVLARAALFPMEASDDTNRYLWEGRLIAEGINPYHHAPNDPSLVALAKTDLFHKAINQPNMPAAYPPFVLGIFSLIGTLNYTPWAVKTVIVAFDLACVCAILQLLRFQKLDERWALLYAVNPVVLYAFAGEAHFDAIQNFFLLAALAAFGRRRWGWMFLAAGLAVQSKYVLAVLLPFLPFAGNDPAKLFDSITRFGEQFAYNGSIHALLWQGFGRMEPATGFCKLALLAGLGVIFALYSPLLRRRYRNDSLTGMLAAWAVLLVFAPTVHFWYVTWLIPLLALRPLRSWLLLCLTICVVFVTSGIYYRTGEWIVPPVLQVMEWVGVLLLLLLEMKAGLRRLRLREEPAPETVSVVIPTRNEGEGIGCCIEAVVSCASVVEVLVVDGGSHDDTMQRARAAGAMVIESAGGRGGQILAGIEQAQGDVIAIVHADSLVSPELLTKALEVLQQNPEVAGGAIGSVFAGRGWRLRLIEFLNDFRAAFLGIGFGDQVQFFRRKAGVERQIFCGIPLMEDVELSLRLGRIGRSVFLFGDVQTSARKWKKAGYGRAVLIIRLVATYLWLRLWGKADADAMYRQYYGAVDG